MIRVDRPARPMRAAMRACALSVMCLLTMGHVGSPDTFFVGQAGPYQVRVAVRLPGVIPGLAQISVRVPDAAKHGVRSVTVQAIQWNVGPEGAPPPDPAPRVPGDPDLHAADLWFMAATSYRVRVVVDGAQGTGDCVVPVVAIATAQRTMSRGLGWTLAGLGLFLIAGLLTIVGAAARESVLPPGESPDRGRRRTARIAMSIYAAGIVVALAGGRLWWNAEALAYAESVLFRPFASTAVVGERDGKSVLTLTINDRRWPPAASVLTRYNDLMPDHGKLMHMFLIREPGLDAFAHVHPVPRQPATAFDLELPPLPPGRYRVFGDIVHESGYAQTLVAMAEIAAPSAEASMPADPDDSWFAGAAAPDGANPVFSAPDGTRITWLRESAPLVAGQDRVLTFRVDRADGTPASLEPYMGMAGHVAVARVEGDVFAHLHPSGSISMAALQKFSAAGASASHAAHASPTSEANHVTTAYAFPKPGKYRVWVQTRSAGKVVTAAFDVNVS